MSQSFRLKLGSDTLQIPAGVMTAECPGKCMLGTHVLTPATLLEQSDVEGLVVVSFEFDVGSP